MALMTRTEIVQLMARSAQAGRLDASAFASMLELELERRFADALIEHGVRTSTPLADSLEAAVIDKFTRATPSELLDRLERRATHKTVQVEAPKPKAKAKAKPAFAKVSEYVL